MVLPSGSVETDSPCPCPVQPAGNLEIRFTGWWDLDLTEKGVTEASAAAGLDFDLAFTGVQTRALIDDAVVVAGDQEPAALQAPQRWSDRPRQGGDGRQVHQSLHSNACLHDHQRIAGAAIRQQVNLHVGEAGAFGIELHKGSMAIGVERPPDRDGLHREAAV